eukprot:maker-scaffold_4-snap-gene-6.2-mRNA-1 protein AED:0.03 eAED:0.03 QI:229/1/1/1/1/1/6/319/595
MPEPTSSASLEEKHDLTAKELEEERQYELAAKEIAEKVQRQQEGLESAMISDEHKDDNFQTMEEIKSLLDAQVEAIFDSKQKQSNSTGFSIFPRSPIFSNSGKSEHKLDPEVSEKIGKWYTERSKYIPVRLTFDERKYLRMVQSVFKVSEYTDIVDGKVYSNPNRRVKAQLQNISSILTSFLVCSGQESEEGFEEFVDDFKTIFELARRYKIMNPEKMRGTYGKMMYLLQDSRTASVQDSLGFSLVEPEEKETGVKAGKIKTVYSVLKEAGVEEVLKSEWISTATREISAEGKKRALVEKELKIKEHALKYISQQFENDRISAEDIKQCILSIGDNANYLKFNCEPVEYLIYLLKDLFSEETDESEYSLAISGVASDCSTSRLSHSHVRQYSYVLQSLTLWREILHDIFRLWYLAEQDLLDENLQYKLRNTGQGMNRLQQAPRTLKAMKSILYAVQQKLGHTDQGWVGSSVIHLGDSNVPNAFMFIDKYNQVPRILNPIVLCLKNLDSFVAKDQGLMRIVKIKYGSIQNVKKVILRSFFREAFDGSGGDNFFEAGSCIDGRLTSAWNWCQRLPEKEFYNFFKLSGFMGFDGDFQT